MPLAQGLADAGHQVLLFDARLLELGDPRMAKDGHKYDLDVRAAAQELTRRGATSVVVGGEVSTAAGAVTVPVFIASSDAATSNGDPSFADVARELAEVSAAPRLDVVPGSSHGAELVKADAGLLGRIVSFAGEVQPKPWYERYMWLMTGGVLVLGLLGSLLVFRRRHNREVSDDRG